MHILNFKLETQSGWMKTSVEYGLTLQLQNKYYRVRNLTRKREKDTIVLSQAVKIVSHLRPSTTTKSLQLQHECYSDYE